MVLSPVGWAKASVLAGAALAQVELELAVVAQEVVQEWAPKMQPTQLIRLLE
jgi:hypothetical protein